MRSRAGEVGLGEVILATGATVDGQTTAHYLTERLAGCDVTVTVPDHLGADLDQLLAPFRPGPLYVCCWLGADPAGFSLTMRANALTQPVAHKQLAALQAPTLLELVLAFRL